MSSSEKTGEVMMEDVREEGKIHSALRKQKLMAHLLTFDSIASV